MLPSAAIFVGFCLLVWWKGGAARGYAVCLLLGALVGVGIRETTDARLAKIQGSYAGQEAVLTAEVESIGRAYGAGWVSAVLRVETVDGEAVRFRVECVSLPRCEAGGRIRGRFALDLPDATQRLSDYADGIALSAEYQSGMLRLGPGRSFRARTARLQAARAAPCAAAWQKTPAAFWLRWPQETRAIFPPPSAAPTGAQDFPMCWW